MAKTKNKIISSTVSPEKHDELNQLADYLGVPISAVIRNILERNDNLDELYFGKDK